MGFYGEYSHTIDAKGRMILPAKFRDGLGNSCFITRGLDKCLFVFDDENWQVLQAQLDNLSLFDEDALWFQRYFYSATFECDIDKQGRIQIPQKLRDIAGLEKEVIVTGNGKRVEIWNKSVWEASDDEELDISARAAKLSSKGIQFKFGQGSQNV